MFVRKELKLKVKFNVSLVNLELKITIKPKIKTKTDFFLPKWMRTALEYKNSRIVAELKKRNFLIRLPSFALRNFKVQTRTKCNVM